MLSLGLGSVTLIVAGRILWWSAKAVLIKLAAPAAAFVCPI